MFRARYLPLTIATSVVRVRPALRLMGFKPKAVLSDYLNLRSPYFLYPNEVRIRALEPGVLEPSYGLLRVVPRGVVR